MDMNSRFIRSIKRETLLTGDVRYGLARNVPATDAKGKDCLIALVVIERDNGAFQTVGISEERIRFHGEGVIRQEIERAVFG
jgi:hypothetical protein